MKTRSAVLYEPTQPLRIEELEIPELLPGQVLVKVAHSGVCRSQLMEARGKRGHDLFLPHLLGHEGSGRVISVGEGVTKLTQGDKIVLSWIKGIGMDVKGPTFLKGNQVINAGPVTTLSTHTIVSENRCTLLPEGIPPDLAMLFGCAVPTGAGIVLNQVKPVDGSTIALFGLGGVGISALMALNLFNCSNVITVDIEETKLALARECGATHTVNAAKTDAVREISNLTGGRGVDYSIEASGSVRSIEDAFAVVKKSGGLCVFASHPPSGEKISLDPHDLISGKRIEGSWGGDCSPDEDIPRFAELYRAGRLPLEKLVSRRYSLEQINLAFNDLEQRKIVRALIDMGI